MEKLRAFLNDMPPVEQKDFAARCDTTIGYLRTAISARKRVGVELLIAIERESGGKVRCEDMRPDVDWAFIRIPVTDGKAA